MTTLLEVKDVQKKGYQMGNAPVPALCGVSFDAREGDFLTIFGLSEAEIDFTSRLRRFGSWFGKLYLNSIPRFCFIQCMVNNISASTC